MQLLYAGLVAVLAAWLSAGEASALSASFRWCSKTPKSTTSPVFTLSKVPKGTSSFKLSMKDLQATFDHGGGLVPYGGGRSIPCGEIAYGWVGPFPPKGEVHTYEFTLKALDATGKELGEARATRRFPE